MKEQRHVIWSNRDLNYEDWRDDLEAEYPALSEDARMALMYELNLDGIPAMGRSGPEISGTACTASWTISPGMWIRTATCAAMRSITMARITICIGSTRIRQHRRRSTG